VPEIELAGYVVPKPRPRLGKGRVFTPRTAELAEEMIRKAWIEAGWLPMLGPVSIDILVLLPRPAFHFGTGRNAGQVKPSAPRWPDVKPDWDNYAKTACDALGARKPGQAGAAYRDDGQIVWARVQLAYARNGEVPGWRIGVYPMYPPEVKDGE
jgi:Holliday junction resolvase RusA-like endonuclease